MKFTLNTDRKRVKKKATLFTGIEFLRFASVYAHFIVRCVIVVYHDIKFLLAVVADDNEHQKR